MFDSWKAHEAPFPFGEQGAPWCPQRNKPNDLRFSGYKGDEMPTVEPPMVFPTDKSQQCVSNQKNKVLCEESHQVP